MIIDYDYDFFSTDESFDYGDSFGTTWTYQQEVKHGITVKMDLNNKIHGFRGYGFYEYEVGELKTLSELKQFILDHLNELDGIEELGAKFTKKELLEELIELIDENIEKAAA